MAELEPAPLPDDFCLARTAPLTANDLLEAGPVLIVCLNLTRHHVPLRAVTFALDVTLPVRDENGDIQDGAVAGETGSVAGDRARAIENYKAFQRLFRLVARFGGGRVRLPDLRHVVAGTNGEPDRYERTPFLWLADIEITEGAEFIIDGLLMVPTGGLTEPWFRDIDNEKRYPKDTCVTFASGIEQAAISGTGVVDGNARGNIATVPLEWIQPTQNGAINWSSTKTAQCRCHGIVWGEAGGDPRVPPRYVRITGITSRDHLRSCFVGALTNVYLANVSGGDSWTDHIYYFAEGDRSAFARTHNTGTGAVNLDCFGFWRGGALNLADGYVHGLTARDLEPNPTGTQINTNPENTEGRPYAARRLQTIVGPRPFKIGGGVRGLLVTADLARLESVVGVGGRGFEVEGEVFHSGAPDLYYTTENAAPSASGRPCRIVSVGQPYKHIYPRGCRASLRVHRLPGKTVLFENPRGRPVYDLDLRFTVDYHPATTGTADLVTLNETAERVRIHVEAWERAVAGGGPKRFVVVADTHAAGNGKTDTPPAPYLEAPTAPARGVHGVEVSGRVHTDRGVAWTAFVTHDSNGVESPDESPAVSGLVARSLQVVATDGLVSTAPARWRHEQVTYGVAATASGPSPITVPARQ